MQSLSVSGCDLLSVFVSLSVSELAALCCMTIVQVVLVKPCGLIGTSTLHCHSRQDSSRLKLIISNMFNVHPLNLFYLLDLDIDSL